MIKKKCRCICDDDPPQFKNWGFRVGEVYSFEKSLSLVRLELIANPFFFWHLSVPQFEKYFEDISPDQIAQKRNRLIDNLTQSRWSKGLRFLKKIQKIIR